MLWDVDMWRELERVRGEMDRVFGNWSGAGAAYPLVNVYEDDDAITVTAELAGLTKEDVTITFSDGVLMISGDRKAPEKVGKMTAVRSERALGRFEKTLRMPTKVQTEAISASFTNGVLAVTLPKAEEVKPKTIAIQAQ